MLKYYLNKLLASKCNVALMSLQNKKVRITVKLVLLMEEEDCK
jgi:hypothetical protein